MSDDPQILDPELAFFTGMLAAVLTGVPDWRIDLPADQLGNYTGAIEIGVGESTKVFVVVVTGVRDEAEL